MVTGVDPSPLRFLPSIFIAHRVQQSHWLTHALALSASQFVPKKKSARIYPSMHSAGLELTKLTFTRLEVDLLRHRGDRLGISVPQVLCQSYRSHRSSELGYEDLTELTEVPGTVRKCYRTHRNSGYCGTCINSQKL